MNLRVVSKMLGIISLLMGAMMAFSLPWAYPGLGRHTRASTDHPVAENVGFETQAALALLASMLICVAVGLLLLWWGRTSNTKLYRKEAMAVVGLSWALATVLGGLPFYLSGTARGPSLRVSGLQDSIHISRFNWTPWSSWRSLDPVDTDAHIMLVALSNAGAYGRTSAELQTDMEAILRDSEDYDPTTPLRSPDELYPLLRHQDPAWNHVLIAPGELEKPADRVDRYRIRWVPMGIIDSMFESQSGFSTTGATVISDLEDPNLVPHCILFWRSSTHFLGGLGIIVLFVAILGQGTAGKALMRAEMPGPTKEGSTARMQHTAMRFAVIYCGLNVFLTIALFICGMNLFDSLCHAFGTMATGGFSTYNRSVGHFDSAVIDYVITIFMILAGTNFTLLYFAFTGFHKRLFGDIEFRTYLAITAGVTIAILIVGMISNYAGFEKFSTALRYTLFQVVSVITTTGYGTADFDQWRPFGRGVLLLLMFIGGCAGSTGGGMKIMRHILFVKILRLEIEKAFHPRVVRLLWIGGSTVEDQDLRQSIMIYFALIMTIFATSWLVVISCEPNLTWGTSASDKLIDSASAVAATLNNIGPGIGTVGPTANYGHFSGISKLLFVWLMMLGRIEIFPVLVLFFPRFWRPI